MSQFIIFLAFVFGLLLGYVLGWIYEGHIRGSAPVRPVKFKQFFTDEMMAILSKDEDGK